MSSYMVLSHSCGGEGGGCGELRGYRETETGSRESTHTPTRHSTSTTMIITAAHRSYYLLRYGL